MDFAKLLEGGKCIGCGCKIEHFGVCDECAQKFDRERRLDLRAESTRTIPERFRTPCEQARVVGFDLSRADGFADSLATAQRLSFVICGVAGTGKTSLACEVLRRAIESRPWLPHRFQCCIELGHCRSDAGYGSTPTTVAESIRAATLVLDDLGQEDVKGREVVREVVHARHNRGRPTLITTWIESDQELASRYGEGTARRITEKAARVKLGTK